MYKRFSKSIKNILHNYLVIMLVKRQTFESRGHTSNSNPDISVDVNNCEVRIHPIG